MGTWARVDKCEAREGRGECRCGPILSRKPTTWDDFFIALKGANVPADFLDE